MAETNSTPNFITHPVPANAAPATTTQPYTTAACTCYVAGNDFSVNVCKEQAVGAATKIPMPSYRIEGCNGATLTGFKIIAVPTGATLTINGVTVVANQTISKADWANLIFTPTATTDATITFTYQVWASCGNSTTKTISMVVKTCYPTS